MRLASPYTPLALVAVMLAAFAMLVVTGGPQFAWTACRDAVLSGLQALAAWAA